MQFQLLVLVAVVLVIWLYLRRRGQAKAANETVAANEEKAADTTYHAVSIRIGKEACAAAKSMAGQRFLSTEAPRIPLPECDTANCKCHFIHHKDRRAGKDRRSPFGAGSVGGGSGRFGVERRQTPDRRKSDDEDPS